jgi:hypothetical protein
VVGSVDDSILPGGIKMKIKDQRGTIGIFLCLLGYTWSPAGADILTLKSGEVYSGLGVLSYDGRKDRFSVEKNGKMVEIRLSEVAEIRFDSKRATITLPDDSVYTSVEVQSFEGDRDRFAVRRGPKVVDIRSTEVKFMDFRSNEGMAAETAVEAAGEVAAVARALPPPPVSVNVIPPPGTVTPAEGAAAVSEPAPETSSSEASAVESESTPNQGISSSPEVPAGGFEIPYEAPEGWSDDALYAGLGAKLAQGDPTSNQPNETAPAAYVPRWKSGTSGGGAKGGSLKGGGGAAGIARGGPRGGGAAPGAISKGSISKKSPSSSSRRSSRGEASDQELANRDQSRGGSDSSRGSSSRSRRSSRDRGGSRSGGSRFGSDSGSRSGGGRYGGSSGGYGSSGGGYGGSGSSGGSRYGGSSGGYGSSGGGYGGSGSYGGSRYGGSDGY